MAYGHHCYWFSKTMIADDKFRIRDDKIVEHWDVTQEETSIMETLCFGSLLRGFN